LLEQLLRLDSYLGEIDEARKHAKEARASYEKVRGEDWSEQKRRRIQDKYAGYYRWAPYNRDESQEGDPEEMALQADERLLALDRLDYALEVRATRHGSAVPKNTQSWVWLQDVANARASSDRSALAHLSLRDDREANRKLWTFALADDMDSFTARVEDRGMDARGVVDFLEPNDELARWVRYSYPTACTSCGLFPLANQIASRRDAAIAAGATDVETEMGAAAKRIRALLYRRDSTVILSVISDLSPP
jgi:hypothetical protein